MSGNSGTGCARFQNEARKTFRRCPDPKWRSHSLHPPFGQRRRIARSLGPSSRIVPTGGNFGCFDYANWASETGRRADAGSKTCRGKSGPSQLSTSDGTVGSDDGRNSQPSGIPMGADGNLEAGNYTGIIVLRTGFGIEIQVSGIR